MDSIFGKGTDDNYFFLNFTTKSLVKNYNKAIIWGTPNFMLDDTHNTNKNFFPLLAMVVKYPLGILPLAF